MLRVYLHSEHIRTKAARLGRGSTPAQRAAWWRDRVTEYADSGDTYRQDLAQRMVTFWDDRTAPQSRTTGGTA